MAVILKVFHPSVFVLISSSLISVSHASPAPEFPDLPRFPHPQTTEYLSPRFLGELGVNRQSLARCELRSENQDPCLVFNRIYGAPPSPWATVFERLSCQEIASETAPSFVSRCAGQSPQNWWPVCSTVWLSSFRRQTPTASLPAVLDTKDQRLRQFDSCTPPRQHLNAPAVVENRYQSGRPPTTQAAARFRRLEDLGMTRSQAMNDFLAVKQRVKNFCCDPTDSVCQRLFDTEVRIDWCEPRTNANEPDRCIDFGDSAGFSHEHDQALVRWFGRGDIVHGGVVPQGRSADFPLGGASVSVLPGLLQGNNYPGKLQTLAHEFGHVCSYFRKQRQVRAGPPLAWRTFIEFYAPADQEHDTGIGCMLTSDALESYRRIFSELQMSSDSIRCLEQVAQAGVATRFPPRRECPRGCPRWMIEESLADWIQFMTTPNGNADELVQYYCRGGRDSRHPLPMDSLTCFLKTPRAQEKLRAILNCS
jgi:hypothetical protein